MAVFCVVGVDRARVGMDEPVMLAPISREQDNVKRFDKREITKRISKMIGAYISPMQKITARAVSVTKVSMVTP